MYRLRVRDPDDDENYVDILIAGAAALQDPKVLGQETGLVFNNTATGSRFGHSHTVINPSDESQTILVERPDALAITDPKDSSRDIGLAFRNNDPPPRGKDWQEGDPSHYAVRVVRYCKDNDPEGLPWIDSEWIDAFAIADPKDNSQDRGYVMRWPTPGDPIDDADDPFQPLFCFVDPSLDLDDRPAAGIDDSWRTDPLQNIVNVNWGGPILAITIKTINSVGGGTFGGTLTIPPAVKAPISATDWPVPGFVELNDPVGDSDPFPDVVNPISALMRKVLRAWSLSGDNGAFFPAAREATTTVFINLKKYYQRDPTTHELTPTSLDFKIVTDEVTAQVNQWQVNLNLSSPTAGGSTFQEDGFQPPTDFATRHTDDIAFALAQPPGDWVLTGDFSGIENNPQTNLNFDIKAGVYKSLNDFSISPDGTPTWDFTKAISTTEKTKSGGPMPSETVTITVALPSFALSSTMTP